MTKATHGGPRRRTLLESRLAYHLRCLREDATDPEMSGLVRLALVGDRARRIREIRQELKDAKARDGSLANYKDS
ncbi:MAG: hypothetical protein ABSD47_07270 [Candidatus Methylomirabilota bacterium]|jgi:hypothetical protein